MPLRSLTDEEVATYRESGFVKVRDILSSDELDRFAAAVDREMDLGRVKNLSAPETGQIKTYATLMEDSLQDAGINFIVDHPNIVGAVERLLGRPALLSAFSIHIKRSGWRGTIGDYQGTLESGHCDYKPFRPVGSSLNWLFNIIPLVDYTEDIGPLLVSPGSHRCSRIIESDGRITKVKRAGGSDIPDFVDTRLKRGEVLFMNMFTWHEAYPNRSDRTRIGVYNRYMAANAPPGCGPYLFSDENYRVFKSRGSGLLQNHSDRLISSTRLLLECEEKVLFVESENGSWSLPGGTAQIEQKMAGSDDDNVIEQLYGCLKEQLGIELPWVSYIGDYPNDENRDLCRVYAYPEPDSPEVRDLSGKDVAWLSEAEISRMDREGQLVFGFELEAVRRWLHEPLLRGIGQSRSQVGVRDVKLVST